MEFWTEFYKEIAGRVRDNLPEIRWVDLWHDQVGYLTEELPFDTPALFVGFSTVAVEDRGTLVQECDTQVDMYLFFETFSDSYSGSGNQGRALAFLESLTRLHALFHGKGGSTYAPMRRVDMRREESGGAGNLYRISFQCLVADYSAQTPFDETEAPGRGLDIIPGEKEKGGGVSQENAPPLYDLG